MSGAMPPRAAGGWWRPTVLLAGSGAAGQLLLALGSLFVVVLYTPAELGAAAAFVSVVSVLSVVAAARYDLALPVVATDAEARRLLVLCLVLVMATAVLAEGLAIAFGAPLVRALEAPRGLMGLRFAVGAAVAVLGAVVVLSQWATRRRAYGLLARTRLLQAGAQVGAQGVLGLAGAGATGLAIAAMVGGGAGIVGLAREPAATPPAPSGLSLRALARDYRRFPTYALPSTLFAGIAGACGPLLVAALYDLHTAGLFALAQRVASIPIRIAGEAVSRTFFGDTAELARTDPPAVARRLRRTALALAAAGAVPALVLALWGPQLVTALLGDTWAGAGGYVRPLAPLLLAQFVAAPINQTFVLLDRLGVQAALAGARLLLSFGPLVLAAQGGASASAAVAAFALGGTLGYMVTLLTSHRLAR